jgi:hypothetical protein
VPTNLRALAPAPFLSGIGGRFLALRARRISDTRRRNDRDFNQNLNGIATLHGPTFSTKAPTGPTESERTRKAEDVMRAVYHRTQPSRPAVTKRVVSDTEARVCAAAAAEIQRLVRVAKETGDGWDVARAQQEQAAFRVRWGFDPMQVEKLATPAAPASAIARQKVEKRGPTLEELTQQLRSLTRSLASHRR